MVIMVMIVFSGSPLDREESTPDLDREHRYDIESYQEEHHSVSVVRDHTEESNPPILDLPPSDIGSISVALSLQPGQRFPEGDNSEPGERDGVLSSTLERHSRFVASKPSDGGGVLYKRPSAQDAEDTASPPPKKRKKDPLGVFFAATPEAQLSQLCST